MKTSQAIFSFLLFSILFTSQISTAAVVSRQRELGLGIVIGEPTAITGKLWLGQERALDFGLSYSFDRYFLVYGDHLWHFPNIFRDRQLSSQLFPYVGIGGGVVFFTDTYDRKPSGGPYSTKVIGYMRIPLGLEWIPLTVPLGVFIELVPGISILPAISSVFNGGIGIRYYF